ncbi:MAG: alpha/beta hydrolase [Myxococcota bacterium]
MVATVRVSGRCVGFRREDGDGPTLVCMHGAADNHHAFDRLLNALSGVSAVAVDRPGRLESEGPPLESLGDQADFMQEFVEAEVEGPYVLAGHSLGGAVTIELALRGGASQLAGIVLLATGARLRVHPTILQLFERLAATGEPAGSSPGLTEGDADPDVVTELEGNLRLTPSSTGLVDWRSANQFDRLHEISQISVPTLVVGGTADALTPPKYAEFMHTHIPNARLHLLEGAGHMFVMERADAVAGFIRDFIVRL